MITFQSPVGLGDSIYYLSKIGYDKLVVKQGIINKVSFTKSTTSFGIKDERNLFVLGSKASLDKTELELIAEIYNKRWEYEHNKIKAIQLDLYKEYLDSEIRLCIYRDSVEKKSNERVYFKTELQTKGNNNYLAIKLACDNKQNIDKLLISKLKKLIKSSKFKYITDTSIKF